jgi:mannose-1-phosphate guanylyltransferase
MNYAVIMAGGVGARFWPCSRVTLPKQLLPFGGDESLLAQTMRRLAPVVPLAQTMIVTGDALVDKIAAALPDLPRANLLAEPLRRNTAPCAAVAAKILVDRDPDATLALLPADQVILDEARFQAVLRGAFAVAAQTEAPITLGVTPTRPETGYGYIELAEKAGEAAGQPYHRVAAFHEKPNAETAEQYLATGRFLWNAGIFVFRARAFLQAIERLLPEVAQAVGTLDGRASSAEIKRALDAIFPELPSVSIDVGVMEKLERLYVFPADIGWSDVGSWTALAAIAPADAQGNITHGEVVVLDGVDNIIYAKDGVVAAVGVSDVIIVHTPDATLVARRDDAQAVKRVFDELERRGWKQYL